MMNDESSDVPPTKKELFDEYVTLPREIKTHILSFLPMTELAKMREVGKYAKELSDDKYVWQERIRSFFPYLEESKNKLFQSDPKNLFKLECQMYNKMIISNGWRPLNLEGVVRIIHGDISELNKMQSEWDVGNVYYKSVAYALAALSIPNILEQMDKIFVDKIFGPKMINREAIKDLIARMHINVGNISNLKERFNNLFYYDPLGYNDSPYSTRLSTGFKLAIECGQLEVINSFLPSVDQQYIDDAHSEIIRIAALNGQDEIVKYFLNEIDPAKATELDVKNIAKTAAEYHNHDELAKFIDKYQFVDKPKNTPRF